MHPPSIHSVSPQNSIMQQLLMAPNGPTRTATVPTPAGNTINEIAARTFRQSNGNGFHTNGTSSDNDWMETQALSISNNTPTMFLKCAECGLAKNSSEDLEVHVKQEHLNWLPFQCPICLSERASDAQMREHLHSSHRKNMNKFIYVDNVAAKRNLQILMDRSFTHAMTSQSRRPTAAPITNGRSSSIGIVPPSLTQQVASQILNKEKERREVITLNGTPDSSNSPIGDQSPRVSVSVMSRKRSHERNGIVATGSSNTDALLAQINAATSHEAEDTYDEQNDLALIFGSKRVKTEYDAEEDLRIHDESDYTSALVGHDPSSVLESLFANSSMASLQQDYSVPSEEFHMNAKLSAKHTPTAKKRVLGECSKCQKPVTAGARQMHMFYHLGKDHGIYRFRCRFESCNIEHYRKDQMENHHSKVHGRIDPDMMEDRSLELYQRCQELSRELFVPSGTFCKPSEDKDLSMELIGTNNCTPGPTAAKAQIVYNQQIATHKQKQQQHPKKKVGEKDMEASWQNKAIPDDEHPLECQKCHKQMQNRIRGFHILWHLAKDLGINRYTCKFCDFGHDRSQSVQTHGKREHGSEDVVLDRIDEYAQEIKDMSQACFGFQALFSQESRRRSKIPLAPVRDVDVGEALSPASEDILSIEDVEEEKKDVVHIDEEEDISPEPEEPEMEEVEEDDQEDEEQEVEAHPKHSSSSSARHSTRKSTRRFGTRKAPSKSKRVEMARLREISMKLGGAQYFKKKVNEAAHCEICGVLQHSRMSEHCYKHLNVPLFVCPHCDLGNYSRETVVKHMKEMHEDCGGHPVDQRLKYALDIKNMIQQCYPSFFVDAPIPTANDIEKLKSQLGGEAKSIIAGDESEDDEHSVVDDEDDEEKEEEDGEEEFE